MKVISLFLVAAIALTATAVPISEAEAGIVEPLNCPCGPGKRDPWHPACCPSEEGVSPKKAKAVVNSGTAKPACPCGSGKRDPWHPVCCPEQGVSPKEAKAAVNSGTAKPACPCGSGKRDPWHPVCCPEQGVSPKEIKA
ncbi:hypothetical protein EDD11_008906 [Mortierella claussenii]|nr:hypothetical protein EDD11_008906 [Mortierella claussenii]